MEIVNVAIKTEARKAVRFTNDVGESIALWCGGRYVTYRDEYEAVVSYIFIPVDGLDVVAKLGDWIMQEDDGNFYPYNQRELDTNFDFFPSL